MTQEPKSKTKSATNTKSKVRVGIDVGGTFTHAVALDSESLEMIEKVKVHTTHTAKEGVAKGIIDALQLLLEKSIDRARACSFHCPFDDTGNQRLTRRRRGDGRHRRHGRRTECLYVQSFHSSRKNRVGTRQVFENIFIALSTRLIRPKTKY